MQPAGKFFWGFVASACARFVPVAASSGLAVHLVDMRSVVEQRAKLERH